MDATCLATLILPARCADGCRTSNWCLPRLSYRSSVEIAWESWIFWAHPSVQLGCPNELTQARLLLAECGHVEAFHGSLVCQG